MKAKLNHFNSILWVVWRHQQFLSIGRHDYKKAELESVYRVRQMGSGAHGRSPGIKGMVKGICSKSWQPAGKEVTEMRDSEKED